jgi:hypothetical protein
MTQERQTYTIVVDEKPTFAGIDPLQQAHRPDRR